MEKSHRNVREKTEKQTIPLGGTIVYRTNKRTNVFENT